MDDLDINVSGLATSSSTRAVPSGKESQSKSAARPLKRGRSAGDKTLQQGPRGPVPKLQRTRGTSGGQPRVDEAEVSASQTSATTSKSERRVRRKAGKAAVGSTAKRKDEKQTSSATRQPQQDGAQRSASKRTQDSPTSRVPPPKVKASKPTAVSSSTAKNSRSPSGPQSQNQNQQVEDSGVATDAAFKDLSLHPTLLRQLEYLQMQQCTPIQAATIPTALRADRDFLLRAPTGSGKTLAFLLPVLHRLLQLPDSQRGRSEGTLAVILAPTKELVLQTQKVAQNLVRMVPSMVCGAVAGGEKPKSEKARLRKGLSILCATPGRLAYHLDHTATLDTSKVRCFVLDEADRLLDMGFEPQVRLIYRKLTAPPAMAALNERPTASKPRELQTFLVSATLSQGVRKLADFCLRPQAVWASPDGAGGKASGQMDDAEDLAYAIPATLTQWYCTVPCRDRLSALIAAVLSRAGEGSLPTDGNAEESGAVADNNSSSQKAIVFFSSCASVDFHHDLFVDAAWPPPGGIAKEMPAEPKVKRLEGGFVTLEAASSKGRLDVEDEDMDDEDDEEEEGAQGDADNEADEEQRSRRRVFGKVPLYKLHGNLSKEERAGYINDFGKGAGGALLASDAASRGLDFPKIDWIIQYDPPQRVEEYLHRVGRTARIGRKGNALLFLQPSEMGFLDVLRGKGLKNFRELTFRSLLGVLANKFAPNDLRGLPGQHKLLEAALRRRVQDREALLQQARSAFFATLRAYRAIPKELRSIFPAQEIHVGHWASSFALREPPGQAVKHVASGKGESASSSFKKKGADGGDGQNKGKGRGGHGRDHADLGKTPKEKGSGRGGRGRQGKHATVDEFAA